MDQCRFRLMNTLVCLARAFVSVVIISTFIGCSTFDQAQYIEDINNLHTGLPEEFDYEHRGQIKALNEGYYYNKSGERRLLKVVRTKYTPSNHKGYNMKQPSTHKESTVDTSKTIIVIDLE